MIISNPFLGRSEEEITEIKKLIKEITIRVKDRNHGLGDNWSDEREEKLQNWLDEITEKYDFEFRWYYAKDQSLFFEDYKKPTFYG